MKRTLLFMMSLLLLVGTQVSAQTLITGSSTAYWQITGGNTLAITGTGEIPDFNNAMSQPWYEDRTSITTITIASTITKIGKYNFAQFSNLTALPSLDNITVIGYSAFDRCSSLQSLTIPGNVKTIDDNAFAECTQVTTLTLSEGVEWIGIRAFQKTGLTTVTLPASLEIFRHGVFDDVTNLTEINVTTGNTKFVSENGILYNVDKTKLLSYPKGKTDQTYTLPTTVTHVADTAFLNGNTYLTEITLPAGLEIIGGTSFAGCTGLTSVEIPSSVTYLGTGIFYFVPLTALTVGWEELDGVEYEYAGATFSGVTLANVTLYVPAGTADLYRETEPWTSFGSYVEAETPELVALSVDHFFNISDLEDEVGTDYDADAYLFDSKLKVTDGVSIVEGEGSFTYEEYTFQHAIKLERGESIAIKLASKATITFYTESPGGGTTLYVKNKDAESSYSFEFGSDLEANTNPYFDHTGEITITNSPNWGETIYIYAIKVEFDEEAPELVALTEDHFFNISDYDATTISQDTYLDGSKLKLTSGIQIVEDNEYDDDPYHTKKLILSAGQTLSIKLASKAKITYYAKKSTAGGYVVLEHRSESAPDRYDPVGVFPAYGECSTNSEYFNQTGEISVTIAEGSDPVWIYAIKVEFEDEEGGDDEPQNILLVWDTNDDDSNYAMQNFTTTYGAVHNITTLDTNDGSLSEALGTTTYDQVWDTRAMIALTLDFISESGDVFDYLSYLADGGKLLLLGEEYDNDYGDRNVSLFNFISLINDGVIQAVEGGDVSQTVASPFNTNLSEITFNGATVYGGSGNGTFITHSATLGGGSAILWEADDMIEGLTGQLIVVWDRDFMLAEASAAEKQFVANLLTQMSGESKTETPPGNYYTVNLEVAAGINLHNLQAGVHQVQENGHLHLQFLPEDRSATAADILFLVDGVEVEFNDFGEGSYYSYILNPIAEDRQVLIAMREYTVTLPDVEGVDVSVGAGAHQVAYGQSFTFSLTLADTINPDDVTVYANGSEVKPNATRATTLTYTIDKVVGPITVVIEGVGEGTTGNMDIAAGKIHIAIDNGQLTIDNEGTESVQVQVYNVAGQLKAARVVSGRESIALQPGVYFVRTAAKTYKVVVP